MDEKTRIHTSDHPTEIVATLPSNFHDETPTTSSTAANFLTSNLSANDNISPNREENILVIGSVIKNRFILDKLLGEGGMGAVYRALDLRKQEAGDPQPYVAIKILGDSFKRHPRALITLQREAKKTQQLAHPNIVTVYDFDRDDSLIYLTMEELKGKSLGDFLKQKEIIQNLTFKERCSLILQIAQALSYAHAKGLVHSDLKPANVFVTESGTIKVLDFGIARAANQETYQDNFDAGELGGFSFNYASLEMLNFEPPHPSDDVYALGIMACQIFGGFHPYGGREANIAFENKVAAKIPSISNFLLRRLLYRSVALERSDRIADAKTFINKFYYAIKAPRRLLVSLGLILILGFGNYFYVKSFQQEEISFESLTDLQKQQFYQLINESELALSLGDLEGAAFTANKAFLVHSTHEDIQDVRTQILQILETNIDNAKNEKDREFFSKQLDALKEYPAFAGEK